MIAAAPLLGLLGTVSGLVRTFESLSARAGQNSMEGLAGILSAYVGRPVLNASFALNYLISGREPVGFDAARSAASTD